MLMTLERIIMTTTMRTGGGQGRRLMKKIGKDSKSEDLAFHYEINHNSSPSTKFTTITFSTPMIPFHTGSSF